MDRKTIRRYGANSGVATGSEESVGQIPPARPPAPVSQTPSACEPHRAFIEEQIQLGRNARWQALGEFRYAKATYSDTQACTKHSAICNDLYNRDLATILA